MKELGLFLHFYDFSHPSATVLEAFPTPTTDRPHRNAYAQEGRVTVAMAMLPPNFLASMHVTY